MPAIHFLSKLVDTILGTQCIIVLSLPKHSCFSSAHLTKTCLVSRLKQCQTQHEIMSFLNAVLSKKIKSCQTYLNFLKLY